MQQQPTISQPTGNEYPPVNTPELPPEKPHEGIKSIISIILIVLAAPLIALTMTTFVFQSYEVDGQSMETTLQDNDRLVVLKIGKTWASFRNKSFVPKRGEIIIFTKHDNLSVSNANERQLIKRVIGLPGERVVVKNGSLTVYNKDFPEGFSPDESGGYKDNIPSITTGNVDIVVPDGEVFVCGDNRNNSQDSRYFGTVSSDDIIGSLSLRIYPFSKFKSF